MNIYSVKGKRKSKNDKSLNSGKLKTDIKERKRHNNDPLTREEIEQLLNGTDNITDHTLLFIGFYTGMRVSEIVSMEEISLNEQEGRIHIWDEKKNRYRDIYVPKDVFSVTRRYINSLKERKEPRIFPFTEKTAERKIQYWTQKILGKTKSWHAVRHTYISLSRELELPMEIVISNTGDTPATILKYYSKPSPQFIRRVIEERKLFEVK